MPRHTASVGPWTADGCCASHQVSGQHVTVRDVGPAPATRLGEDHEAGDAGHVAHQHRLGQQVGEEGQPAGPREEADGPDRERQHRGGVLRGLPGHGDRREGGAGHQGGRRLGAHRQLGRGPDEEVHRERDEGGPEPRLGRDPGQPGVGQDLGHQVGGHRDAGDHVASQRGTLGWSHVGGPPHRDLPGTGVPRVGIASAPSRPQPGSAAVGTYVPRAPSPAAAHVALRERTTPVIRRW